MASDETEGATPPKRSKLGLLVGLVLAVLLGAGGFYAAYSGMILSGSAESAHEPPADDSGADAPPVAFVPLDPMTISLAPGAGAKHLRFQAQLEVEAGAEEQVAAMLPRVIDVLNSFLRAVEPELLADPASLAQLRAQMLRRVRIATGSHAVRDLLVMEFVLN
ncbi:flagellar FliL protein [Tranquillimonas rosea]|uniref:Flagellar protein FliL n=1 Tax=Tranquillimonas rosea TaxID=641238 RepID=A0A1H9UBY2_9RHOB|nr:flagellar basal body-associated FliL family protein [Tranquillimonas rosea]SES06956.1 flagellar FliL protein [Tranquillimonas rosea]